MFFYRTKNSKSAGFTLIEVATTTVIIAVAAMLAIPKFSMTVERSRSSEGVQILSTLWQSQQLHTLENGVAATVLADLDADIVAGNYFDLAVLYTSNGQTAYTDRSNGNYRLYIDTNGDITCDDTPGLAGICNQLNFTAYPF